MPRRRRHQRRENLGDPPNPEAARQALRMCSVGPKVEMVRGRCQRCGYGESVSEQMRFQRDCWALEEVATDEDRDLLERATVNRRRRRPRP